MTSSPILARALVISASVLLLGPLGGCGSPAATPAAGAAPLAASNNSAVAGDFDVPIALKGNLVDGVPSSVTAEMLETLPMTEYTVMDPYALQQVVYRGVLVRDLVARYGRPDTAAIHLRAIDDFKAEITRDEWTRWDVLLATRKDGQLMSIDNSGPARIVFPYDTAPDIDHTVYADKWIWQINAISFDK